MWIYSIQLPISSSILPPVAQLWNLREQHFFCRDHEKTNFVYVEITRKEVVNNEENNFCYVEITTSRQPMTSTTGAKPDIRGAGRIRHSLLRLKLASEAWPTA